MYVVVIQLRGNIVATYGPFDQYLTATRSCDALIEHACELLPEWVGEEDLDAAILPVARIPGSVQMPVLRD